jgi:uncharacterized protein YoaH (UPF0181 family)
MLSGEEVTTDPRTLHLEALDRLVDVMAHGTSQRQALALVAEYLQMACHHLKADATGVGMKEDTLYALDLIMRGVSSILEGPDKFETKEVGGYAMTQISSGVKRLKLARRM